MRVLEIAERLAASGGTALGEAVKRGFDNSGISVGDSQRGTFNGSLNVRDSAPWKDPVGVLPVCPPVLISSAE